VPTVSTGVKELALDLVPVVAVLGGPACGTGGMLSVSEHHVVKDAVERTEEGASTVEQTLRAFGEIDYSVDAGSSAPRRWLLIRREVSVPSEEAGLDQGRGGRP
jgi:hypothetical protein